MYHNCACFNHDIVVLVHIIVLVCVFVCVHVFMGAIKAKRKLLGEGVAQFCFGGFPHVTQQGHVHWHCGCRSHTHDKVYGRDCFGGWGGT